MILVQDIIRIAQSAVDDDGNSDRYTFSRDWQPAIIYASNWLVNAFSSVLGTKKFPEENLSDLVYNRIFVTNMFSRVVLDTPTLGKVWSILNISINPTIYPNTSIAQPDLTKSVYSPLHSFVKAYKSAQRETAEEVNINRLNPFAPGNEVTTCEELKEYGYKLYTNYEGGYSPSATTDKTEIEILPSYPNKILAIEYIKQPTAITSVNDNLEFPTVLTDTIVQKVLNFISFKQSNVPLTQASQAEVQQLITLMS